MGKYTITITDLENGGVNLDFFTEGEGDKDSPSRVIAETLMSIAQSLNEFSVELPEVR